ncbi:MAG: hypothetical protein LQ340_007218 [Diploschistes diacapsis]|nr:MAG: hypothetical protein LQ340_007218 [Diploschistes diacapsis]
MATGNPGFGGGIRWDFQADALKYGPAVTLSTDTGHVGAPNNISCAINNPDGIVDWSYRSLHESTVLGKQLTKAYYGNDVQHSYYTACSNGGRQGLKEVQMFPDDYDGVLPGAPPWQTTHLHPWALQLGVWNLPENKSSHIPSWKFDAIANNIMEQCDAQDGLADQIIMEPYSCNFSSAMLMCNQTTTNTTACLSAPEIDTLSLFYNDWQNTNGTMINPHFPLSASASRYGEVTTAPNHFDLEYFYGFVYNTTDWDWTTFKGQETVEYVDTLNTGDAAALSMDLSGFRANGDKLIMYHGLSDTTVPTGSSIQYYQGVNGTMQSASGSIDDFFQLYLVPGMGHCGESDVTPYYIAAAGQIVSTQDGNGFSVPGYVDPEHDILLAMFQRVENGTAPQQLIASKWNNDTLEDGLLMQSPLCPYSQKAVYSGHGDWHDASSWTCQAGELLQFPAQNGSIGTVKAVDGLTAQGTFNFNCTGCGDNCTEPGPDNGGNSSSGSGSGSKSGASAAASLATEATRLAGWAFLGLLGIGCLM